MRNLNIKEQPAIKLTIPGELTVNGITQEVEFIGELDQWNEGSYTEAFLYLHTDVKLSDFDLLVNPDFIDNACIEIQEMIQSEAIHNQ